MDTKIRALLWEELRVGGAIAGAIALVSGMLQVTIRIEPTLAPRATQIGGNVDAFTLVSAYGYPLLLIALLTLNTSNSGHLLGGFSRRILRLPVETWQAVLTILLTRTALVLTATIAIDAMTWALFGNGPQIRTVLIFGTVFLMVQTLDWLRGIAQLPVLVLSSVLGIAVLGNLYTLVNSVQFMYASPWSTGRLIGLFLCALATFYGVSLGAVHLMRCGYRLRLAPNILLGRKTGRLDSDPVCKPFRSQFSAQFWYELRANGWALPGATALIWVGGIALRWLMAPNDSSPQATADGTARVLDPLWSCEIIPSLAIVAAAVVTSITARRRGKSKGRPTDFLLRLPAIPVDKVRAEQLACAVPLAGTLAVVAAVNVAGFLNEDHGLILRLMREASAAGEMTWREFVSIMVGAPLLSGLAAWSVVFGRWDSRPMKWKAVFIVAVALDALGFALGGLSRDEAQAYASFLVELVLIYPAIAIGATLLKVRGRACIPRWSLLSCLLIWIALTAALYPYTVYEESRPYGVTILLCASLALFPIAPFFALMRRQAGVGGDDSVSAPDKAGGYSTGRLVGLIAILTVLGTITVGRSMPSTAYREACHGGGA